jgi:UDP-3-O-[3-hydroxymyristoyl] glucosamine N-acyltransferase
MYRYPTSQLNNYIYFTGGSPPQGVFMDFVEDRKEAFQRVFNVVNIENSVPVPPNASLDRFAVVKPKTRIGENVLVAQRAFL